MGNEAPAELKEVLEQVEQMCADRSIPKNVREVIIKIRDTLQDESREMGVRIDAAVQEIEGLSSDVNLSSFTRAQIWSLTSALSSLSK